MLVPGVFVKAEYLPVPTDSEKCQRASARGLQVGHYILVTDLDPRTRVHLLETASTLAWHQHDFDTALTYAKDAFQLEHEYGGENENPMYRNLLGRIYIEQGKFEQARIALEECLVLAQKRPGHLNPGSPFAQLGEVYFFEGRLAEARSALEKALTFLDKGDAIFLAIAKTENLAIREMREEFL